MWFRSIFLSAAESSVTKSRKAKKQRSRRLAAPLQLEALENRSLLTFMAPVNFLASPSGRLDAMATGDFAHNGIQDLAVANGSGGGINVLMGNGDGTFKPPQSFTTGGDAMSVAAGDLTSDGRLDLVALVAPNQNANYPGYYLRPVPTAISVLLGNGDGTFQAPLTFTLPEVQIPGTTTMAQQYATSVAIGDMNHDGHPDLVVTANAGKNSYSRDDAFVDVLLGHGDGSFTTASTTLVATTGLFEGLTTFALGDFDGNGNLDVAVPMVNGMATGSVAVLRGNGDGTLDAPTYISIGVPITQESLAVGDLSSDGKLDLVVADGYAQFANGFQGVTLLMGNGDGTFQPPENIALPTWTPLGYHGFSPSPIPQYAEAVVVGDLNGDGKMDLAVVGRSTYTVLFSKIEWDYYGRPYTYYGYYNLNRADVNVLFGNGQGAFTDAQIVPLSSATPVSLAAANLNGDTLPDLAVGDYSGTVSVLLNGANWSTAPQPTSFSVNGFPSSIQAGTPGSFTVTALNADGTVDAGYTGTVDFTSSDGQAALPGSYTFTAADAGVHTFSAMLKTAGTQSITATDTTTLLGTETSVTVTPAAASHFAVSAPSSSMAGSALGVTVTALDAYNNTATGYAGTVQFTSSDGQAVLPGDYLFTAADAGVHTFASGVTLKTAGSQTVAITDMSTSSVTGGASVLVNAAAASTMMVSGFPSPMTAGAAGSVTVTLKDAYGNIATGYTGTVHFTSSDAQAVLPANYTFTPADAGKHTFNATLKTAGTQSISATDTVNAALHGSDSGITVKAAAASKFVLSAPSSAMPGQAFSLTVTVEDAYGNIVTGYTGTIHFSSSDNKAILPTNYTFTASDSGVHTFTGLVLKKTGNQTITVTDTQNSSITGKKVVDVV